MCERAAASSCWSPPWARRGCGGQRPSPPMAPGQRHDRWPCPSPQAVSRSWPALLGSWASQNQAIGLALLPNAAPAPRRVSSRPELVMTQAQPRCRAAPARCRQGAASRPSLDLQDDIDGTGDAGEGEARLGLGHERVQPAQGFGSTVGVERAERAVMAGVHGADELECFRPTDLAQRDPVGRETQRLPQQHGKVGGERGVEVDDIRRPAPRARACPR